MSQNKVNTNKSKNIFCERCKTVISYNKPSSMCNACYCKEGYDLIKCEGKYLGVYNKCNNLLQVGENCSECEIDYHIKYCKPKYSVDDEDSEDLNDDDRRDREFEKAALECKINSLLSKSLRKMKTTCNNKFELEILDQYLKKFEQDLPNYKKRLLSDQLN